MAYADAVIREAKWFTTEPAFTGCPPLLSAFGGPFDTVAGSDNSTPQGYPSKILEYGRNLYLWRENTQWQRLAFGELQYRYHMVAVVLWSFQTGDGSLPSEMAALDSAMDSVFQRIRGVFGDKTHGGAFNVGLDEEFDLDVRESDAYEDMANARPFRREVRYQLLETAPG